MTQALSELASGQSGAAERVMPAVYARLHALAESYLRSEPVGHTLQPTALVNEAYLKLVGPADGGKSQQWESRAHFFAVAAKAMRQILVDHARTKKRLKRGGDQRRVPLTGLETPSGSRTTLTELDIADLDDALTRLSAVDSLAARITEMRFFGGMEVEDIASVLGTTDRTIRRHWVFAKAWLCRELAEGGAA